MGIGIYRKACIPLDCHSPSRGLSAAAAHDRSSSLDQLPLRTSAPSVVAQRTAEYGWNVGKYGR